MATTTDRSRYDRPGPAQVGLEQARALADTLPAGFRLRYPTLTRTPVNVADQPDVVAFLEGKARTYTPADGDTWYDVTWWELADGTYLLRTTDPVEVDPFAGL